MPFLRRRFFADNYLYVLSEGADAALVDPADPEVALAAAGELGGARYFSLDILRFTLHFMVKTKKLLECHCGQRGRRVPTLNRLVGGYR